MDKTLLQAAWVASMDGPVLRDGAVVFAGERILAVGRTADLRRAHPEAQVRDLGAAALLPGLINCHTHLELSALVRGPAPARFVDWLLEIIAQSSQDPEDLVRRSLPIGVEQCLACGVTCVGDISRRCDLTRSELRQGPLRVVSYGEVQGMARRRDLLESRLATAADVTCQGPRLTIGLSPHAPYSIEPHGVNRCLQTAQGHGMPLAMHLAETADEAAFLADHSGPFMELWQALGAWDDRVPTCAGGPVRFAAALGLLDYPTLLAHVNYCDDAELSILAKGRASVAYCPRTHAFFGHPPHRWRQMLAAGINVAVATDSAASAGDVNILQDLRLLGAGQPQLANGLWPMVTLRAARALGLAAQIGSLSVGKMADMVAFPVGGAKPLAQVIAEAPAPLEVWIGGRSVKASRCGRG